MCWGVPGRVVRVKGEYLATVDFGGSMKDVVIGVDGVKPGEYVLVHAGVIISRMTLEDVVSNISIYRELIYHQLLDQGYSDEEAKVESLRQVESIYSSLGIDLSSLGIGDIDSPGVSGGMSKMDGVDAPRNAFKARYRIPLSDTDYLQVMHYTNYFRYCERAQQELLEEIGYSYSTLIHRYGLFIPTVESYGSLKAPVRLDNVIEVYVWVEEIGRKHIKWRYIIYNLTSGRVVAECYTTSVCTDTTLMEAVELPSDLRERLKKYYYRPGEGGGRDG